MLLFLTLAHLVSLNLGFCKAVIFKFYNIGNSVRFTKYCIFVYVCINYRLSLFLPSQQRRLPFLQGYHLRQVQ